jgi:hypothetical protein
MEVRILKELWIEVLQVQVARGYGKKIAVGFGQNADKVRKCGF